MITGQEQSQEDCTLSNLSKKSAIKSRPDGVGLAKIKLFFNKEGKFEYESNRMKLREEDAISK